MATKGKKPGGGKPTTSAGATPKTSMPASASPAGGGQELAVPSGGIGGAGAMPPSVMFANTLGLEADTSEEFSNLGPVFGEVLESIGDGIASSQDALDRGMVDTAKRLSETKITVVTDVIQVLDEDGLPDADQSELVTNEVSLINYVRPTVHEWKHVALSMDLSVGAVDNERGISFSRSQSSSSIRGAGLFWGFVGWFNHRTDSSSSYYQNDTRQEADWARGQVRLDAQLGPRELGEFPVPAQVSIGPQISFSQGTVVETVTDDVVTARSMDVIITVRKANGDVNSGQIISLDSGPFRQSFSTTEGFSGTETNTSDGQCKVTLTRDIPNPRFLGAIRAPIKVQLGQMSQSYTINL